MQVRDQSEADSSAAADSNSASTRTPLGAAAPARPPPERSVHFRRDSPLLYLSPDVLPGFTVPLRDLFPDGSYT